MIQTLMIILPMITTPIHDMYGDLFTDQGFSCCGGKDCRPVDYQDVTAGGVNGVMFHVVDGDKVYDVFVPEAKVKRRIIDSAHPERAHWCGKVESFFGPFTICA